MTDTATHDHVIEQLQHFGLKTYEAKCFVALSRVPQATAREISEITDVPRTRVYDAIGVLETDGLVTVQHTNPKVFRAVTVEEATNTLRQTYQSRLQSVQETLETIEPASLDTVSEVDQELWALSGREAVAARTQRLISEAEDEIRLLIHGDLLDSTLSETLRTASERGVRVIVGVITDSDRVDADLSEVDVVAPNREYLSRLGFLLAASTSERESPLAEPTAKLARLAVVDGQTVLLSTSTETASTPPEQSICASGETNGLVVLSRNLLTSIEG